MVLNSYYDLDTWSLLWVTWAKAGFTWWPQAWWLVRLVSERSRCTGQCRWAKEKKDKKEKKEEKKKKEKEKKTNGKERKRKRKEQDGDEDDDEDQKPDQSSSLTRGKGRGTGKGRARGRGKGGRFTSDSKEAEDKKKKEAAIQRVEKELAELRSMGEQTSEQREEARQRSMTAKTEAWSQS